MQTITGIHGVPRSGTSWLSQIFNASRDVAFKFQPLFSYAFKDYLHSNSSSENVRDFFNKIYKSEDEFVNMRDLELFFNYPKFEKNEVLPHLVFKNVRYHHLIELMLNRSEKVKFILLLRNPLSVLNSWKRAPREFKAEWNFEEEWEFATKKNLNRAEEYFGYYKWKEAGLLFLKLKSLYPERIHLITYANLLVNTESSVNEMFSFAGIDFDTTIINFINDSKSIDVVGPNSVYRIKKKDESWKGNLPKHIIDAVEKDLLNSPLEFLL